MSIGSRVVLAVTFQKVNNAPDTKTCAQGHYESLQNTNCAVKKFHKIILLKNVFDFGLSCCVNLVHIEGVRGFYHGTLLLPPKEKAQRKKEIERCLYEVFRKYGDRFP